MDPKILLSAPLAPTFTKFEGKVAPKKTQLFSKKRLKTIFLSYFFKFLLAAQKVCPIQDFFTALGELEKSI